MCASLTPRMSFSPRQTVRTDISKKPDEFRDRKLTELTTAQVIRAVLKSPAGEIELAKKNEHWEIVKPLQARGDDQRIGDLLAQVTNARVQEFVGDDHGDLHAYGLSEPRGSITIYGPTTSRQSDGLVRGEKAGRSRSARSRRNSKTRSMRAICPATRSMPCRKKRRIF